MRQTCPTVEDRVCCEKHSDAWWVTADFVFRGDRRSAIGMWGLRQSRQLAYLLSTHADTCLFIGLFIYLFHDVFCLLAETLEIEADEGLFC